MSGIITERPSLAKPGWGKRSPWWRRPPFPALMAAVVAASVVSAFWLTSRPSGQQSWATLGTTDVHSLVFVDGNSDHLLFGHHEGVLESRDGGRTWEPLGTNVDAMALTAASDRSVVVAGHEVLTSSPDGGATWQPVSADLPSLDIHGFTRDPADPTRMWAYLATGGLWETTDGGLHWSQVREDNVAFPLAVPTQTGTRLLGVDASGLVASDDGGRTWAAVGTPPTYPMTAFAASSDGGTLYAGSTDGLFRSADGGRTWTKTTFDGFPMAIAVTSDSQEVALVAETTDLFRSFDAGVTWTGPA